MSHAKYLEHALNQNELSIYVDKISDIINKQFPDIDYIAGSGISGIVLLSAVAYKTGKRIFIVRRSEDDINNHSCEGKLSSGKNVGQRFSEFENILKENKTAIIIDDLIATGDTVHWIDKNLSENGVELIGIILYHETGPDTKYYLKALSSNDEGIPLISVDKDID